MLKHYYEKTKCQQCERDFIKYHKLHKFCSTRCSQIFSYHKNKYNPNTSAFKKRVYSEKKKEYMRKWTKKNRIKRRAYMRKYIKKYLEERPDVRIKRNLRKKLGRNKELLGCSYSEFLKYLESKFKEGMSWNNYGKWHIDHIIPISIFNLTKKDQQEICFHYTNLQPLWAKENYAKRNKITLKAVEQVIF